MDNYIAQRLSALGVNQGGQSGAPKEVELLRAENARLKQQLEQTPPANFKSEAQVAFEQTPEFEATLNAFYMRFVRDKFGAEFRSSPHVQEFQSVANAAFAEFEKNFKKEVPKNAQNSKRAAGNSEANAAKDG